MQFYTHRDPNFVEKVRGIMSIISLYTYMLCNSPLTCNVSDCRTMPRINECVTCNVHKLEIILLQFRLLMVLFILRLENSPYEKWIYFKLVVSSHVTVIGLGWRTKVTNIGYGIHRDTDWCSSVASDYDFLWYVTLLLKKPNRLPSSVMK